jgi:hypothetical protein
MWDESDHFGRWVQGLCSLALVAFLIVDSYLLSHGFGSGMGYTTTAETALWVGAAYLAVRCFWYAFTGKDNINRDDYD